MIPNLVPRLLRCVQGGGGEPWNEATRYPSEFVSRTSMFPSKSVCDFAVSLCLAFIVLACPLSFTGPIHLYFRLCALFPTHYFLPPGYCGHYALFFALCCLECCCTELLSDCEGFLTETSCVGGFWRRWSLPD